MNPVLGRHLFALEGQNEIPYGEANQRLALDRAHLSAASPGSPPTPLGCRGEWYNSFGSPGQSGSSVNLGPENHQGVLSQPGIVDAQGQSFESFCADREAESLTGLPGGANVHLGLDGAPDGMVHCCHSHTLSVFAEASCHQPLSSVRFYLISDGLADGWSDFGYDGIFGSHDPGEMSGQRVRGSPKFSKYGCR